MKLSIIGLGLLGGSLALDLRKRGFADQIFGYDKSPVSQGYAKQVGLIDEECTFDEAIQKGDIIIISVPVSAAIKILPEVLNKISDNQIVIDICSTKGTICERVKGHSNRRRYVACHPMAGTENSGPWSAISGMFDGKALIICDSEDSDEDAVKTARKMFEVLNMNTMFFNSFNHDVHVAYVSHLSHVCSFALALTVLDKERNEKNIFSLASGGFASTVRLAKSNAEMWVPIFDNNKDNVLDVLDTYIDKLKDFRELLQSDNIPGMMDYVNNANRIRKVLK